MKRRRRRRKPVIATRTTYWMDSKAIATRAATATRRAAGARAACRGRKADTKFAQPVLAAHCRRDNARLSVPAHEAEVTGTEHDQTERDTVPGERREIMVRDIAKQPAHAGERADERHR